jgi:hypothetical protein
LLIAKRLQLGELGFREIGVPLLQFFAASGESCAGMLRVFDGLITLPPCGVSVGLGH